MSLLLVLAAVPGAATYVFHPEMRARRNPAAPANELSMETLPAWAGEALWIDARAEEAYTAGHVPGAVSLPAAGYDARLADVLDRWTEGRRVIVYCDGAGCDASREVAERLHRELGLGETYYLKGGWDAWKRAQK